MSPKFGRIDLAAELYDDDIFDSSLFSKLEQQGRPFIILNASNLGPGRRFDFTQQHFDAIGSRLDQFKVARAVAASSAFPFLLSAVSLKNWPLPEGYQPPGFYKNALKSKDWTSRRYNAAYNLEFYFNKENGFIHLMDGGLSDNIGAQAILDAYDRGFIRRRINQGAIKYLVFIVINARTEDEDKLSKKEAQPGLITVAGKTATVAMDNYSFESVERLRSTLYERVQNQKNLDECQDLIKKVCNKPSPLHIFQGNIDPYVVEINFKAVSQIPDEDPNYYLNLPTSFKLNKEQIGKLIGIGPKLLRASPMYQCLLNVLAAESACLPRPENCPVGAGIVGK
jgi:NTE family protein